MYRYTYVSDTYARTSKSVLLMYIIYTNVCIYVIFYTTFMYYYRLWVHKNIQISSFYFKLKKINIFV